MTPTLNDRINESWDAIHSWAQGAGEFVAEQAPLVAWETVAYGRAVNTLGVVIGLLLMLTLPLFLWCLLRSVKDQESEVKLAAAIATGFMALAGTIGGGATLYETLPDMLKSWFAPRLYVLEYVADLIGMGVG